jgi:hypothetical protein
MDILDSKHEIKNSKVLWLILGILLIPVFNSVDSLFARLFKISGFPIFTRIVLSVGLHTIIIVGLLASLFWIIRNWNVENPSMKVLTLKHFRIYGLVFLAILLAGRVVSCSVIANIEEEMDLLEQSQRY